MCVLCCVGPAPPPPGGLADPVRQVLALLPLHLHRIHLLSRSLFDIVLSKSNQLLSDFPTHHLHHLSLDAGGAAGHLPTHLDSHLPAPPPPLHHGAPDSAHRCSALHHRHHPAGGRAAPAMANWLQPGGLG